MSTVGVVPIQLPMPTFPPMFDMTSDLANREFAKVPYWLRNADHETALIWFMKIAKRMFLLRHHALLGDRHVEGHLWDAAEGAGLVARYGEDKVQSTLAVAADEVRAASSSREFAG